MRVLKVRRISRDTEDSSALARQSEELDAATEAGRYLVAGEVEDSTVSGAVNLDERPKLGRWMKDPLWYEWDALMVTSLDRITRDQHHWDRFAERCHKGGKEIVCLDDPALDIHTPRGRMIAYIKATQAQEYREAIVKKRRNQTQYYRDESLWGGGTWPFGYRPALGEHKGKQRYKLIIDPLTGPPLSLADKVRARIEMHGGRATSSQILPFVGATAAEVKALSGIAVTADRSGKTGRPATIFTLRSDTSRHPDRQPASADREENRNAFPHAEPQPATPERHGNRATVVRLDAYRPAAEQPTVPQPVKRSAASAPALNDNPFLALL